MLIGIKLLLTLQCYESFHLCKLIEEENKLTTGQLAEKLAKKEIIRKLWIAAGMLMLTFPQFHIILTLGLLATFLSFTIWDESH